MSQQCVNVHAHHANLIDLWYSVAIHHLTIYCTFKSFQISIIFMNAFCMSLKSIVTFSLTYIPNFACSTYMYIVLVIMDFVLSFFFRQSSYFSGSTKSNALEMHINRKYGTYEFRNIVYWTYFRNCNSILQNPWKLMPENTNIESKDYDFKIYYIWFEHFYCYVFTKLCTSSYDVIFIVLHLLRRILFTLNTHFLS